MKLERALISGILSARFDFIEAYVMKTLSEACGFSCHVLIWKNTVGACLSMPSPHYSAVFLPLQRVTRQSWTAMPHTISKRDLQGSHRTWKTWKNRSIPGKPGKTGGFGAKTWKNITKPGKNFDLTLKKPKNLNNI